MSTAYENRSLVFFAVDYPAPDLGDKLPGIASKFQKDFPQARIGAKAPVAYGFSWPKDQKIMLLSPERFAWQTMSVGAWRQCRAEAAKAALFCARGMEATELKRIGFKLIAYIPESLSHAELADLFFDSLLGSREIWSKIGDNINDPLLQIFGTREGMQFTLEATAANSEQIAKSLVSQLGNRDLFLEDKLLDSRFRDLNTLLTAQNALLIDIDLFKLNAKIAEIESFSERSLACADKIIEACQSVLKSKKVEKK